jgi:hypothetical protein
MQTPKSRLPQIKKTFLFLTSTIMITLCFLTACTGRFAPIQKALEDHYKDINIREIKVDIFCVDPESPDRAYASATLLHNFANRDGNPQKEYIGHILKKVGDIWQVDKKTTYTTKESEALELLAGKKIRPFPSYQ